MAESVWYFFHIKEMPEDVQAKFDTAKHGLEALHG
jgi:hypothetical protein